MSKLQKTKSALHSTVKKLTREIEETRKKGKIPADYSLGFTNGLIFVDHQLNEKPGKPKFYDRTMCIGELPKPCVLLTGNAIKDSETHQFLQDAILVQARGVISCTKFDDEKRTVEITDETVVQIRALKKAFNEMEKFLNEAADSQEKKEVEQDENVEQEGNQERDEQRIDEGQKEQKSFS